MTRKLILFSSLILIAFTGALLIWTRSVRSLSVSSPEEAQAVKETIQRAWRIQLEAEYTFDTSQYSTVYINDPRGGEISDEALTLIQKFRQDPDIQKAQVGFLDSTQADIENLKREYDNYMAELRSKQAAGTLHEEERLILEGETYGWPTPEPEDESAAALATQTCELFIAKAATQTYELFIAEAARRTPNPAYPEPETYFQPILSCPTPIPTPKIWVSYRGTDPARLPPEEFEIDIDSIEIEGEVARAVVHKRVVTSEYVLVKVDGQWYIAGTKLIKVTP